MITTTLKGVFPEPKPTYRRNFIRENVSRIKQMQGLVPLSDSDIQRKQRNDKLKAVASKVSGGSNSVIQTKNKEVTRASTVVERPVEPKHITKIHAEKQQKFFSRGIQTERLDDMSKLYESGVVKYANTGVQKSPKKDGRKGMEQGDSAIGELFDDNYGFPEKTEHNYVRENIMNLKPKLIKNESARNPNEPPPTYQKGVVPKYLKDRKCAENTPETQVDCPPGHILLPEEERKETLRVLRQSYADRVQELNSLPVRSDTLRMKKKKMDLETELKKIDEGIKVFQRPKVFVKINA